MKCRHCQNPLSHVFATQPRTRHQAPSTKHQAPSTKHQARSTKHEARSTKHEARSTKHEARSTKHEAPTCCVSAFSVNSVPSVVRKQIANFTAETTAENAPETRLPVHAAAIRVIRVIRGLKIKSQSSPRRTRSSLRNSR